MNDKEFDKTMHERLGNIEGKLDVMYDVMKDHVDEQKKVNDRMWQKQRELCHNSSLEDARNREWIRELDKKTTLAQMVQKHPVTCAILLIIVFLIVGTLGEEIINLINLI